jgi:hypothetical protein
MSKLKEEKKEYVPPFANNLVESLIGDCPPSALSKNNASKVDLSKHEKEVVSTEDQDCVMKSRV